MHEMSLMQGIFNIIEQTLAGHQVNKVTKVRLQIGVLTNAVPDSLRMCFDAFARGTKVEGAQLEIDLVPLLIECTACGQIRELAEPVFLCPNCAGPGVKILSGRELKIESLEVE